jgi:cell division protein FtsZ
MSNKKIAIVGLGRAGIKIVSSLQNLKQAQAFTLLAIDSDKTTLDESPIAETNKILLGYDWKKGNGCGGDAVAGGRVFSHERSRICTFLQPYDLLFFVGGLGRGTAGGGVSILTSEMHKMQIPSIFVLTLPFMMEGPAKYRSAENLLKSEIHNSNNVVITIPNDLLFSKLDSNCTLQEAFELSNSEVAKSILTLALVFSGGNLLSANYADLLEIIAKKKHFASIGIGTASAKDSIENRFNTALNKMLMSPLLGGLDNFKKADAVIISLIGGDSLKACDTKYMLEKVTSFVNEKTELAINFSTDENFGDSILLSCVAINFDKNAIEEAILDETKVTLQSTKKRKNNNNNGQGSLDLTFNDRGIFEKTRINYYDGVDLDIPSYQRKNIMLK